MIFHRFTFRNLVMTCVWHPNRPKIKTILRDSYPSRSSQVSTLTSQWLAYSLSWHSPDPQWSSSSASCLARWHHLKIKHKPSLLCQPANCSNCLTFCWVLQGVAVSCVNWSIITFTFQYVGYCPATTTKICQNIQFLSSPGTHPRGVVWHRGDTTTLDNTRVCGCPGLLN